MAKATNIVNKKRPGRPLKGADPLGTVIAARWTADEVAAIDAWCVAQDDSPKRAEAIRRLVRLGLSASSKSAAVKRQKRKR